MSQRFRAITRMVGDGEPAQRCISAKRRVRKHELDVALYGFFRIPALSYSWRRVGVHKKEITVRAIRKVRVTGAALSLHHSLTGPHRHLNRRWTLTAKYFP